MSTYSSDDEPIVDLEKRQKAVQTVLGDPTIFPPDFLVWLKRYIEQAGVTLPYSSIYGVPKAAPQVTGLVPVGAGLIFGYGGATAPAGALFCDGSDVSRTTYSVLFAAIGTGYGTGDGSTTFGLPDLRGRVAVGKGTHADVDALNDNDGSTLANRSPKHKHTVTDPTHTHAANTNRYGGSGNTTTSYPGVNTASTDLGTTGGALVSTATGITVTPGGTPPDHTPAYVVVNYIITTGQ